ncbi:MAG: thioredoxin [Deltaproteobacteria bacterium]|jgi:thioredoxin 1|nr:thioredoxin [Deltaproteobacteria bacterium]
MSKAIVVDSSNFETEILRSEQPVLVDFWAPWCGPCRSIGPILESLAGDYEGKVKVAKVNVDEVPDLAKLFQIRSIPTLYAVVDGEVVDSMVGFGGKAQLQAAFASLAKFKK